MKTIEEQIEVMQAYADGKNIKRRADSPFTNSDKNTIFNRRERTTDFSWASFDYNIVEEPITKYMIVTLSGGSICDYPSYAKAKKVLDVQKRGSYKIIKLIEDMDFNGEEDE